jgi:hypothetical protein
MLGEPCGNNHAIPPRHDWRLDHTPRRELDWSGHTDADRTHVGGFKIGVGKERTKSVRHPLQDIVGSPGDFESVTQLANNLGAEVGHGEAAMRNSNVSRQHDARLWIKREKDGTAPTGGFSVPRLDQQTGAKKRVEKLGDR